MYLSFLNHKMAESALLWTLHTGVGMLATSQPSAVGLNVDLYPTPALSSENE